jgi:hypothetical protein
MYKKLESPGRLQKVSLKSPAPMHFPLYVNLKNRDRNITPKTRNPDDS